jgi:hypothetical protein
METPTLASCDSGGTTAASPGNSGRQNPPLDRARTCLLTSRIEGKATVGMTSIASPTGGICAQKPPMPLEEAIEPSLEASEDQN